jgi:hypothetical protein
MPLPNASQTPLVERGGKVALPWLLFLNGVLSWVPAPAHDNSPGKQGQVAYDSGFFYICTAKDTWKRAAIANGF